MVDFVILKSFKVDAHASKAPLIKQVDWHPPLIGWIKCNTDDTTKGNPGYSIGGGLFRDFLWDAFLHSLVSHMPFMLRSLQLFRAEQLSPIRMGIVVD